MKYGFITCRISLLIKHFSPVYSNLRKFHKLTTFTSVRFYRVTSIISCIMQLHLTPRWKFYCIRLCLHVFYKHAQYSLLRCPMLEYLEKCSLVKHTCSRRNKLIIIWALNIRRKINFTCINFDLFFMSLLFH